MKKFLRKFTIIVVLLTLVGTSCLWPVSVALADDTVPTTDNTSAVTPVDNSTAQTESSSTDKTAVAITDPTPAPAADVTPAPIIESTETPAAETVTPTPETASSPSIAPTDIPPENPQTATVQPDTSQPIASNQASLVPSEENTNNTNTQENSASSVSVSGQNQTANSQSSTVETGQSVAQTTQTNLVNTDITQSDFNMVVEAILGEQSKNIDLNALWQAFVSQNQKTNFSTTAVEVNNGSVNLDAQATAISGQNQSSANTSSSITTGESTAVTNVFNLVNLNINESQFLISVINIIGTLNGDIILPNQQKFLEMMLENLQSTGSGPGETAGTAQVNANVSANADSGSNTQTNNTNQTVITGDATAAANEINYANINLYLSSWYNLIINNLGIWDGQIIGWQTPGSNIAQKTTTAEYSTSAQLLVSTQNSDQQTDKNNSIIVNSNVSATAISGQNSATDSYISLIKSGKSTALANLFNFININFFKEKFFMPIINILGKWKGNLIFAYPNLVFNVTSDKQDVNWGDEVTYSINYSNTGEDGARNVVLKFDLPQEESLVSTSIPISSQDGNRLSFDIGYLSAHALGNLQITTRVNNKDQAKSDNILSFFNNLLVGSVMAETKGRELVASGNLSTSDRQSDTSKNSGSNTIYLNEAVAVNQVDPTSSSDGSENSGELPILTLSSSNNVNEFVYPGDTVTFFVTVQNAGPTTAKNTTVFQQLFSQGIPIAVKQFSLGDIAKDSSRKLTFGLIVPKKALAGEYESDFYAQATNDSGAAVDTDKSVSTFRVNAGMTQAASPTSILRGVVLAADFRRDDKIVPAAKKQVDYYLLLLLLAPMLYVEYTRRRETSIFFKKVKKPYS